MKRSGSWLGATVATTALSVMALTGCGGAGSGGITDEAGAPIGDPLDAGATDAGDTGTADGTTPLLYFGNAYLAQLFDTNNGPPANRFDRTFKFYTEVDYAPASTGASVPGTMVRVSLTPIKKAATTVSKADTSGAAAVTVTVPVSASGKFVAKLGALTIPADVNPQAEREVVIENVVLTGVFKQPGRFCSVFAGEVPTLITFTSKDNVVLFDAVTEGAAQPVHGKADFAPGCPIPAE